MREAESTNDGNRWEWMKQGKKGHETESLLCAAQEQALQVTDKMLIRQVILHYAVKKVLKV